MESTELGRNASRQSQVLSLPRTLRMTSEQFWELCQLNRDWRLERTAQGDIVVMPPTGALTGKRNARLIGSFLMVSFNFFRFLLISSSINFRQSFTVLVANPTSSPTSQRV